MASVGGGRSTLGAATIADPDSGTANSSAEGPPAPAASGGDLGWYVGRHQAPVHRFRAARPARCRDDELRPWRQRDRELLHEPAGSRRHVLPRLQRRRLRAGQPGHGERSAHRQVRDHRRPLSAVRERDGERLAARRRKRQARSLERRPRARRERWCQRRPLRDGLGERLEREPRDDRRRMVREPVVQRARNVDLVARGQREPADQLRGLVRGHYAFCIWDDGFLPSDAEWNYAASGGGEQRFFPWSTPPGSEDIDCTFANYGGGSNGLAGYCSPGGTNRVGSESPKGTGSGDTRGPGRGTSGSGFSTRLSSGACVDCANTSSQPDFPSTGSPGSDVVRVNRGGGLGAGFSLEASSINDSPPTERDIEQGARCARAP